MLAILGISLFPIANVADSITDEYQQEVKQEVENKLQAHSFVVNDNKSLDKENNDKLKQFHCFFLFYK